MGNKGEEVDGSECMRGESGVKCCVRGGGVAGEWMY